MTQTKKIFSPNGQALLSAKAAAKRLSCAPDYVGKLCREGKLTGVRENNAWFVDVESIAAFEAARAAAKVERSRELSAIRKQENREHQETNSLSGTSFFAPTAVKNYSRKFETSHFVLAAAASFVIGGMVFGASALLGRGFGAQASALPAALAQVESPFFGTGAQITLPDFGAAVTRMLAGLFGSSGTTVTRAPETAAPEPLAFPTVAVATTTAAPASTGISSGVATAQTPVSTVQNIYPIRERVVERVITQSGITQQMLSASLEQLNNSLRSELYTQLGNINSLPASGGVLHSIALSQNISRLSGVTITNSSIEGYLPLSGGTLTGALGVSSTGTSTFSGGLAITGGCVSVNGVCLGTGGGGAGTPGGADTQVQFNDGGVFNGDSGFTYNAAADRLTLTFASTTAISATYASSTNLYAGVLTLGSALGVSYGGTGLLNAPIYGQVLVGNSAGGYDLVSTSSLGIVNNGGTGFSTTSADYWASVNSFSGFSTTSADYWSSLGLGFSTTSANYWSSVNNFTGFSTTSADYHLSVLDKGYFFSTTSAAYWASTNSFSGFSTTSANYWFGNGASTTQLSVLDGISVGRTSTTTILGSATSTFGAGIAASYLNLTGTNASSTLAGGLVINGGGLKISTLTSAACDLKADANGNLYCGLDSTSTGAADPFTFASHFGSIAAATSSPLWAQNGIFASSTSHFADITAAGATTTALSVTGSTTIAGVLNAVGGATFGSAVANSLTVGSLNGPLQANNGVVSATSSVGVLYGGTGLTAAPSYGQLLLGNGTGYTLSATSTLGLLGSTSISAAGPLSWNSSTGALSIAQSGTAANGYLSSTDWNLFNNKISSSSLSAAYPLSYNSSTGIFTTAFSTTTQNTFSAHNSFVSLFATNASTTNATTTNLAVTGVTSSLLKTNSLGQVVAAVLGVDYQNFGYLFPGNATTTQLAFNGGLTAAGATTTALSVTGSTTIAGVLNAVGGATFGSATVNSLTLGNALTVGNGGTGSTTLSGLIVGNGTGAVQTATVSGPLSLSGSTLSISQSGAGTNGYLSSTDWNLFNDKISSSSLSGGAGISYNASSGVITNTGVTSLVAGAGIALSGGTGAVTVTNTIGFPYASTQNYGALSNATSTAIWFQSGLQASSTSYLANAVVGTATTTNLAVSGVPAALLKTNALGQVVAAVAGTDYLTSGTLGAAGRTWEVFGSGASAYLAPTTTIGAIINASSTIGSGTQAGGLTIAGGATTTGTLYVGGTGTSTYSGGIIVTGGIVPSANNTYSLGAPDKVWHSLFIGPGSLYVNNQKVISTNGGSDVVISSDPNENLIVQTSGTANIELNPAGGQVQIKNTINLTAGKSITTTDLSALPVPTGVAAGNITIAGNSITAANLNGGISLTPNGSGGTYVTTGNFGVGTTSPSQKLSVSGNAYVSGALTLGSALGVANGGTGTSTLPSYGQVLLGNAQGGYDLAATSTLGLASFSTTSAAYWASVNSFSGFSTTSANYWSSLGLGFSTTSADYHLSTLDKGYFFSTTSAAYWASVNSFSGFSTTSAQYFVHSSTTIPKTYSTNTFTGANAFTGSLTVGSLNGPLQANNGVVSATSSVGVLYGGTGLTAAPSYGQLLLGNGTGYTLSATSTLGLLGSTSISAAGPLSWNSSTGALSIAQSGTAANGYLSSTDWNLFNDKISSSSLSGGAGISYNSATGVITNTIGYLFPGNATTTQLAFNGGLTAAGATTTALSVTGSTTIAGVLNAVGGATFGSAVANSLTVGSLNGPLQANNGVVSATSSVGVLYGGTGLTAAPSYGQLLIGNGGGGYSFIATSTLGLSVADIATGTLSVQFGGTGVSSITGLVVGNGTTPFSSITDSLGLKNALTDETGSGALVFSNSPTLVTPVISGLLSFNNASTSLLSVLQTAYFGATATSSFDSAGTLTLAGSLNGPLQANNGVVSATSSVGVLYGGTGLTAAPSYGNLLVGNASGGYSLGATSTLGLVTTNVAEGSNLYYTSGRVQTYLDTIDKGYFFSTTSANYFVHASTTIPKTYTANTFTGINTFSSLTNFAGFISNASSTIGNGLQTGGLTIAGGATTTGSAYIAGNLGIGVQSPGKNLDVAGTARVSSTLTLTGNAACTGGQALQTNGSGDITCGTITTAGVSTAGGWTTNNFGQVFLATTTDQVGLGATSTPYAKLSILSGSTATTTLALVPALSQTANILDIYNTQGALTSVFTAAGRLGLSTTTPGATLAVEGFSLLGNSATAGYFVATTTRANVLPYASSTAISVSGTGYFGSATTTNLNISGAATFENLPSSLLSTNSSGVAQMTSVSQPLSFSGSTLSLNIGAGLTTSGGNLILNMNSANNWLALQTFSGGASTTALSALDGLFVGRTSTTTIRGDGLTSTFAGGITAYASSTVGNSAQTGGLTISGGATTTGNAYFGGNGYFATSIGIATNPSVTPGNLNIGASLTAGGVIQGSTGSAAAPTFRWTNDIDTGFFNTSAGSNAIGVSTGGAETARFTATAFGLGTTSPYAKLSVSGFSGGAGIVADALSGFTGTLLDLKVASGTVFSVNQNGGVLALASSTIGNGLQTGGLTIFGGATTTGDAYIAGATRIGGTLTLSGSTSCTGQQALQTGVNGDVLCGTVNLTGITSAGGWTTDTFGSVYISTSTDRVGVGATSTPYAKLSILSGGAATTTLALVPASGQTANIIDIYNTSGALASVLTAAGNFGLGVTAPSYKLEVSGLGRFTGLVDASSFVATSTTATSTFAGLVGVGSTTPAAKLGLQGNLFVSGNIANVANITATGTLSIAGPITSTATAANTLPYASTTALTVSGNSYLGIATSTSINANTANIGALTAGSLNIAGAILSTANSATTLPYASSTALTVSGIGYFGTASTTNLTISSLLANRVPYTTTGGVVTSSANLTFNGTTLAANALTLSNALGIASGGTNATSFATAGNAVYYDGTRLSSAGNSPVTIPYASTTALTVNGNAYINDLVFSQGSSTFQNFTYNQATGTAATTTSFFSTVASSSRFFGGTASFASLSLSNPLAVTSGGSGTNSLTGILIGNGTSPFTTVTDSLGLSNNISDEVGTGFLVYNESPYFGGRVGVGTTSAFAQLSVHATSTTGVGTPQTLFAIASSTRGTATTTLFSVTNTGLITGGSFSLQNGTTTALSVAGIASTSQLFVGNNAVVGGNLTVGGIINLGIASTSQLSVFNRAYFGGTATTTIDSAGNLFVAGSTTVAGVFNATGGAVLGPTTFAGLTSTLLSTNSSGAVQSTTVSSPLTFSGSTLSINPASSGQSGYLSNTDWNTFNNKISSSSLSGTGPITYNSGTGVFGFDTSVANAYTGLQGFLNASSTLFSVTGTAYFGGTATTTIDAAGNVNVAGNFTGAGLSTCSSSVDKLVWTGGQFACAFDAGANGTEFNWTYFNGSGVRLGTSTNQVILGATATSSGLVPLAAFNVLGGAGIDFATTTALFATTASSTNLTVGNDAVVFGNLGLGSSSPYARLSINGGNIIQTATGTPILATTTASAGNTYASAVQGNYIYVADNLGGLKIYDGQNPARLTPVGSYTGISGAVAVAVAGRYAYVGDTSAGLVVVDVSNPTNPVQVGSYAAGDVYGIALSGKYVFAANLSGGNVSVIDVSNPAAPELASTIVTGGAPYGLYASGRYLYVASQAAPKFQVVDISNPVAPAVTGTLTSGLTFPTSVAVSGKFAFIGDASGGMRVINISNPAAPVLTTSYEPSAAYYGVAIAGNYAYAADHSGKVKVIDISNPAAPRGAGILTLPSGLPQGIVVVGKYAYVANDDQGLAVIDINGIDSPAATFGSLAAGGANISDDLSVGNNIFAGGGLNVGVSGIFSRGTISAYIASSTQNNATVANFMGGNVGVGIATPTELFQAHSSTKPAVVAATNDNGGGLMAYSTLSARSRDAYSAQAAWGSNTVLGDTSDASLVRKNLGIAGWGIIGYSQSATWEEQGYFHIDYINPDGTATSTRFAITPSGNIGIGTIAPNYTLDVYGNARVTGLVDASHFVATSSSATSLFNGHLTVNGDTTLATLNVSGLAQFAALTATTATTTNLAVTSVTSALLKTNSLGQLIAAVAGTDYLTTGTLAQQWTYNVGYLSPTTTLGVILNASSTIGNGTQTGGLTISGGATTTGNAYFAGNVGIGTSSSARNLTVANPSGNATIGLWTRNTGITTNWTLGTDWNTSGGKFQISNADSIGTSDFFTIVSGSGNVGISTTSPYAKLSVAGQAVAQYFTATSTTNINTFPLLTATSATTTNLYTLGSTTVAGVLNAVGGANFGTLSSTGLATLASLTVTGGTTLAGATSTSFAVTGSSTVASVLNVGGQLNANGALTVVGNTTLAQATSTAFAISGIASGNILKTSTGGAIVAAVAGTDYVTGAGLAAAYPFQVTGNATSTLTQFNGGLTAFASSTIGNGTQTGGLTISGGATTTGNAYIAGNLSVGSTSPWAKLSISGLIAGKGSDGTSGTTATDAPTALYIEGGVGGSDTDDGANGATGGALELYGGKGGDTLSSIYGGGTGGSVYIAGGSVGSNSDNPGTSYGSVILGVTKSGDVRGKVGIGTASPFSTLSVNGGAAVGTYAASNVAPTNGLIVSGNVGVGTTSPYAKLSVAGQTVAQYFTATSTTVTNTFPLLTATTATTTNLAVTSVTSSLLKTNSLGQLVAAVLGTDYQNFGYLFPANATSTRIDFNGGLTAYASSTIGNGTQTGGLTISGGATTTGSAYIAGSVNISQYSSYLINGSNALYASTTNNSVAVGPGAGYKLSSEAGATYNTAIGSSALTNGSLTGDRNTALGAQALYNATSGTENQAVGVGALFSLTDGWDNVAVGDSAGYYNVGGDENVYLGSEAGRGASGQGQNANVSVGYRSLYNISGTSGGYNTTLGHQAGYTITSGANNIVLGSNSNSGGITSGSNNVLIGQDVRANLSSTGSNQLNVGNLLFGTGLGSGATVADAKLGVGSTTPFAKLSVHANNGDTGTMLFAIGSSTANSTTTLFSVDNAGNATISGSLTVANFSPSSLALSSIGRHMLLSTDGSGNLVASSTPTVGAILATSTTATSQFGGKVSIGSSTPFSKFSIQANNGETNTTLFAIGSSTANSTTTLFKVDNNGNVTAAGALQVGSFGTAALALSGVGFNMILSSDGSGNIVATSTPSAGAYLATSTTATSTFKGGFAAGNNAAFVVNQGAPANTLSVSTVGRVGLGTTTPWGQLSVNPNGITGPAFVIGSSTKTTFVVANDGYVGIASTTPGYALSVTANGTKAVDGAWIENSSNNSAVILNNTGSGGRQYAILSSNSAAAVPSSFRIYDFTASLDRLVVTSGGNVGIGVTSPVQKLEVAGNILGTNINNVNCQAGYTITGFSTTGDIVCSVVPTASTTASSVKMLGFGSNGTSRFSTYFQTTDGQIFAAGLNSSNELGTGDVLQHNIPTTVALPAGKFASSTIAAGYGAYAVMTDGTAYSWGYNGYGQLGVGDTTARSTPVPISGLTNVKKIITSSTEASNNSAYGACALTTAGLVYCWGYNGYGQIGNGTTGSAVSTPYLVTGLGTVTDITTGDDQYMTVCAINSNRDLYCWGYNGYGQIGNGNQTNQSTPVMISTAASGLASSTVLVKTGGGGSVGNTCAIKTNGQLYCWGYNGYGQLGLSDTTLRTSPVAVTNASSTAKVFMGGGNYNSIFYTTLAGNLYAAGYNGYGQLGDYSTTQRTAFVSVATTTGSIVDVQEISYGSYGVTCILNSIGLVYCFGYGGTGQHGYGGTSHRYGVFSGQLGPTDTGAVPTLSNTVQIAGNGSTNLGEFCALSAAGVVKCWGYNDNGELGIGQSGTSYSSAQVQSTPVTVVIQGSSNLGYWDKNNANLYYLQGNVGIGTTTASGKLTIVGTGMGTNSAFLVTNQNQTPTFTVLDNGNVGIGTTTPYAKLSVSGQTVAEYFVSTSTTAVNLLPILLSTSATSTNLAATNFNLGSYTGLLQGVNGQVSASTTLSSVYGGTGFSSYASGDILYANANGTLSKLAKGTDGQILKLTSGLPSWAAEAAAGGGSGVSPWATTTNSGAIYPVDTTDVIVVGSNATTTTTNILEVYGKSYFSDTVSIGSTSPWAKFSINSSNLGASPAFAIGSTTGTQFVVSNGGRVGIGTSTPYAQLGVTKTASTPQLSLAYDATTYTDFRTDATGNLWILPVGSAGGDVFLPNDNLYVCSGGSLTSNACPTGTPSGDGNLVVSNKIGVGTSTPNWNLSIAGTRPSIDLSDTSAGTNLKHWVISSMGGNLYIGTSTDAYATTTIAALTLTNGGRVGIGTTTPTKQLSIADLLYVGASGTTTMGVATSTFQGDLRIIGKLDVTTIDPVYTVGGVKYATYGHSTVGIHEETLQTIALSQKDESGKYTYRISFDNLEKGSDLWLFYQITDFGDDWSKLVVALTPAFDGQVYYEKATATNELLIRSDSAGEVSMRLTAGRYDSEKWPNLRPDQDGDTRGSHVVPVKPAKAVPATSANETSARLPQP